MNSFAAHSESQLLLEISQGSEAAYREIYDRFSQKIYSLAMYLTKSDFMAEEITQEVFLKIWLKKEKLSEINFFNAYLKTIASNVASNYLKRMAMEKLILKKIANNSETSDTSTSDAIDLKEYEDLYHDALQKLPPQQRRAYLLSRQEGLKYEEIAKEMQLSQHTVKDYIKDALSSLRKHLNHHVDLIVLAAVTTFLHHK